MSGQRISLSRIIAINWYGFRQVFDVTNHTLIAGAFGTGKTALLDLIQHVLLGEHWRPNRAAAGNSRSRSLVSYCLCDTNTVRDGEPHYTRSSGVTVIALEFTWPAERGKPSPRRETWGMRIEYSSPTSEPRRTYFLVPDRLDYTQLAPGDRMLEEDVFRTWIKREFEAGSAQRCLFSRQQDYLAEMATPRHLFFDLQAFQKTLVKAIAFEPEDNVEEFIRRFILEESPLDVRDVKAAQDAFRETEARLRRQENEAAFLRQIAAHHTAYEAARTEESIQAWLRQALTVAQLSELAEHHRSRLARLQSEQADDRKATDAAVLELEALNKVIEATRFEGSRDPGQGKLNDLESRKSELHREIVQLREAAQTIRQRLADRHYRWVQWLRHAASLAHPGLTDLLMVEPAQLDSLRDGEESLRLGALQSLAIRFQEIVPALKDQFITPLRQERDGAEQRLRQLAAELDSIGKDRSPGSFPVFEAIQQRVGGRAHQLGRLIEVKPEAERWWPALELFLGRQRWAIVVRDQDYRDALDVLRRVPPGREAELLIHPGEAVSPQLRREVREGSLAEKVEVAHPVARAYVQHLLGEVLGVDTPEELDRCPAGRAITPDGVFKQLPTRRRLRPAGDVPLTLGREGLARMRQAREREQVEVRAQRDTAERRLQDLNAWVDNGLKGGLGDGTLPDRSNDLPRLPKLEADFRSVCETIQLLTTPERAARLAKLKELDERKARLDGDIAVRKHRLNDFQLKARPHQEGLERAEEDLRQATLDRAASRIGVSTRVLDGDLETRLEQALAASPSWDKRKDAVTAQELKARETAANARNSRDLARRELASTRDPAGNLLHPHYQTDFALDDDNTAWDARLNLLETVELGSSRALAADRRKDWERRLQEGVLDRLNEKLQSADRTIRQLREYLNQRIGRHVYRITQRRDPTFSALWSLLESGLSPADPLAQALKSDEIDRAKAELMAAVEAAERADDRARRLLDYRFYHRYDLEMLNADQPDAPGISLGRSGRSLSGGENQAPFFISMLAAFRRVYDVGSHRSPHLGLVVMDEAFSKLSGDGVEDCLELASRFELQLVMAFPIDRLGVMAPYADTVVICDKKIIPGTDGYVAHIENIPILLTSEQALEPLA